MSLDFVPTGIATGVSGSIMGTQVTTAIGAGLAFVPDAGVYYAYGLGADVRMQIRDSGGAWNNVLATAVGGMFCSDASNVRFINNGVASENITLIKVG